jgi:hypothetical protein
VSSARTLFDVSFGLIGHRRGVVYCFAQLIFVTVVALACDRWQPPARPESVPGEAVWAGNSEAGDFFLCQRSSAVPGGIWECTIYDQAAGRVESTGSYWWTGAADRSTGQPPYVSFSRGIIGTQDGDMIPIGRHVSPVIGADQVLIRTYPKDPAEARAAAPIETIEPTARSAGEQK